MASNANKYTIYHLDQDGLLTGKYDHTDGRATCLIDSTNIAWAILKMDIVKAAFVTIAEKHCDEYPTSWFLQDREGTRAAKINNVTVEFLKTILIPKFPTLYISDRMRHLDVLGAIHRDDWEDTFSISSERMSLNGRRLQQMLELEMRAKSAEDTEGHIYDAYRIIQFQFVVTIFHEIGHVFVTWLGKGLDNTPPGEDGKKGESGYKLEELVFGGRLRFLLHKEHDREEKQNNYGAGSVFMCKDSKDSGNKSVYMFRVTKEAIESTLDSKFQFPFKERWIPKLDNKVRAKLTKLEEGEDAEEETEDPANHPEWFDRRNKIDPGWEDR